MAGREVLAKGFRNAVGRPGIKGMKKYEYPNTPSPPTSISYNR